MRVLLPPSEAKNPGGRGRPLDDRPADDSPLGAARGEVRAALDRLLAGDPRAAARALLLPGGVAADALARDAAVGTSRTTPALRRYAGVVYDGLGYDTLPEPARRAAHRGVLIFSGLFGVVGGDEPVPDYRVPAKAQLPGIGVAGTYWRRRLDALLAQDAGRLLGRGLVVDLRSSDYAAMWRPPAALRERVVGVRVLSPLPGGGHGVISHTSKFAKGRLTAALLRAAAAGHPAASAEDVAQAWVADGGADAAVRDGGVELRTA